MASPSRRACTALARTWLWLGLLALIGSGLFSVLLVLSRTPGINRWLPVADFFRVALVVHVDLSVLVWFIAMAGCCGASTARPASRAAVASGWAAPALCAAGALLMSLAPFVGRGEPIMANYIPVLDGPLFLAGLVVFGAGVARAGVAQPVARAEAGTELRRRRCTALRPERRVVSTAVALLAFVWSLAVVPTPLAGKAYYEILFWGGGHALQFTWTLLMLVAWLWLASACGAPVPLEPARGAADVRAGAGLRVRHAVRLPRATTSPRSSTATCSPGPCASGGGLAILPIGLAVVLALARRAAWPRASRAAAARGAAVLGAAVRRRRPDRHLHQRQQRAHPGPLPRLHRRRDAGADGPGLPPAAASGLRRADRAAGHLAAVASTAPGS